MRVGLLTAMAEERLGAEIGLEESGWERVGAPLMRHGEQIGTLFEAAGDSNREVLVLQTGIGKANVALGAALAVHLHRVDALLSGGTAGSLTNRLVVGDVFAAALTRYVDADATAFGYAAGQVPGMPPAYAADAELLAAALAVTDITATLGTADSFTTAPPRAPHEPVDAVDMESAAAAQVAHVLRIPFIAVRAITDGADDAAATDHDLTVQRVSLVAGRAAAAVIGRYLHAARS